jgi:hypothetical protein
MGSLVGKGGSDWQQQQLQQQGGNGNSSQQATTRSLEFYNNANFTGIKVCD